MKQAFIFYFNKGIASIVEHLWRGIWTSIGIVIIMEITKIFIIVTG